MSDSLFLILVSVSFVSLISFVGVFFLWLKEATLRKILTSLVSFASGALLGNAFLRLLPESISKFGEGAFLLTTAGFVLFFIVEKFLYWRHCHNGKCETHTFTYLNLLGDGVHNFIDGAVIAVSFLTSLSLGLSTTLAVIFHEIPQEISDFSILVYGGWPKVKALLFNFLSALTAIAGALAVYFLIQPVKIFYLLPLTAGGFIYIGGTDLIPELHKKGGIVESILQLILMVAGMSLMWLA